jgi:hypothetical protein
MSATKLTDSQQPSAKMLLQVLRITLNGALLRVQDLLLALNNEQDPREAARSAIKAVELAEEGIRQAKTPIRSIVRRKVDK